jgi:hypothetical protein
LPTAASITSSQSGFSSFKMRAGSAIHALPAG